MVGVLAAEGAHLLSTCSADSANRHQPSRLPICSEARKLGSCLSYPKHRLPSAAQRGAQQPSRIGRPDATAWVIKQR